MGIIGWSCKCFPAFYPRVWGEFFTGMFCIRFMNGYFTACSNPLPNPLASRSWTGRNALRLNRIRLAEYRRERFRLELAWVGWPGSDGVPEWWNDGKNPILQHSITPIPLFYVTICGFRSACNRLQSILNTNENQYPIPSPDKPEPKKINHESTKWRKHEIKLRKFSCFRDKNIFS